MIVVLQSTCSTKRNVYDCQCVCVRTQSGMHFCLCIWVGVILSHSLHFKREIIKARRTERNEQEGGNAVMGNLSDVECVCKQIAIFYVNLNLFPSAGYQACWQHGAYLSCWQDEQRDTEGERKREKTCHRWLITLHANSWVLCLHLDSQKRPRWASLIRFSIAAYRHTHTHTRAPIRLQITITHVFDLTWRTVFLITKEFAVMNPDKECDQMWLIKTLRAFWKPAQGWKAAARVNWDTGHFSQNHLQTVQLERYHRIWYEYKINRFPMDSHDVWSHWLLLQNFTERSVIKARGKLCDFPISICKRIISGKYEQEKFT